MNKLNAVIKKITVPNSELMKKTQKKLDSLTKPQGSLGRLEDLAKQIVTITECQYPSVKNKVIFTLAGDHGVTQEGVSAYPKEVTAQMVYNFLQGGAGINVLARQAGARVVVVDIGVAEKIKIKNKKVSIFKDKKIALGTKNMAVGPAMTRDEAIRSLETGIDIFQEEFVNRGIDIVGIGEMGIGNTTVASAITACITKAPVSDITGRGAGLDDRALQHKVKVIKDSLLINHPNRNDPLDVLSKIGGFEIGGLAGIIIASAAQKVPVIIDGFISSAAALIAAQLEPKTREYMIAGHCSVEKGHRIILDYLKLEPLLDLKLRLGEGTGAVLAMNLVESSVRIMLEMATFKNANVSERII